MPPLRVLCVDDEPALRDVLPAILRMQGYDVTFAASVADALKEITSCSFDVLISDLNIGNPGDGLTVVSAMRRTQPHCFNFILTAYPAVEAALQAIRCQVDDYLLKPSDIPNMGAVIEKRLADRKPRQPFTAMRLSTLLRDKVFEITQRALLAMKREPELQALPLSDDERIDPIPQILKQAAEMLDSPDDRRDQLHEALIRAARSRGELRFRQGYTIPLLIANGRILLRVIFDVVNENLFSMNLSYLLPDLARMQENLALQLEETLKAYLQTEGQVA